MNKINLTSTEGVKTRNWAFLIYTENLPKIGVWKQFFIDTGAEICVSPLHNKDKITQADYDSNREYYESKSQKVGELKKPHYHVIVCYPGPTTFKAVYKRVSEPLGGTRPFSLISVPGYYHYLWHDPEWGYGDKFPYEKSKLWKCGGFDITNYIELTQTQTAVSRDYILNFIRLNDITDISDLEDLLNAINLQTEKKVLANSRGFFRDYLNSRRWRKNKDHKLMYKLQDPTTGQITEYIFGPEVFGLTDKEIGSNA